MTSNTVVRNIKAVMEYTGKGSSEMIKACKISRRTWFYWMENPEIITVSHVIAIAEYLGASPAELFEEKHYSKKGRRHERN